MAPGTVTLQHLAGLNSLRFFFLLSGSRPGQPYGANANQARRSPRLHIH
jgi:hypothetical protein